MDPTRLKTIPLFAQLNDHERHQVAQWADEVDVAEGEHLVHQGAFAHEFFVILEGTAKVTQDDRDLAELGAGDFFGEIALLREIPRTATVTARTDTLLYALERDDFLEAVTGHPQSTEAADAVTRARLADR